MHHPTGFTFASDEGGPHFPQWMQAKQRGIRLSIPVRAIRVRGRTLIKRAICRFRHERTHGVHKADDRAHGANRDQNGEHSVVAGGRICCNRCRKQVRRNEGA